jgi:hypothetical protein
MAYDTSDTRESEFNELAFKIARINKLQDKCNILWQAPKEPWFNPDVFSSTPQLGFVLIASNLLQLYKEVRPKCNPTDRKEMDELKEQISELSEKEKEAIGKKGLNGDKVIYRYDHDKWLKIKKLLDDFENRTRDLLDKHGFSPDKNEVKEQF